LQNFIDESSLRCGISFFLPQIPQIPQINAII
jgi:hypothetical protein